MGTENQIIKVKVTSYNLKHFLDLGYNVKNSDIIEIPAKHLSDGSGAKINVQCSYCGKIFKKAWRKYLETKEDICCIDCRHKKNEKIFIYMTLIIRKNYPKNLYISSEYIK